MSSWRVSAASRWSGVSSGLELALAWSMAAAIASCVLSVHFLGSSAMPPGYSGAGNLSRLVSSSTPVAAAPAAACYGCVTTARAGRTEETRDARHRSTRRLGAYGAVAGARPARRPQCAPQSCAGTARPAPAPAPSRRCSRSSTSPTSGGPRTASAPSAVNGSLNTPPRATPPTRPRVNTMTHTGSDGSNAGTASPAPATASRRGPRTWPMGYPDAASVMDGWMNSPGHRANILSGNVTADRRRPRLRRRRHARTGRWTSPAPADAPLRLAGRARDTRSVRSSPRVPACTPR